MTLVHAADSLRLGCVKYLNAQPLIYGWPGAVEFDEPAILCRKLAKGELDVAFVSSFEFLSNPVYTIVDNVALASDGPVYSVVLAHSATLGEIREIVLDPASLTSVNVLRCLLAERGLTPRFVAPEADTAENVTPTRAKLLIGNQAIRFRNRHATDYNFWDLGAGWKETTGLPLVYALWLIRPEVKNAQSIADRLRARRDKNLNSLDEVVSVQTDFAPEFCRYYFRDCLTFRFSNAEKEGLLRFRSLCEKHQILQPNSGQLRLV